MPQKTKILRSSRNAHQKYTIKQRKKQRKCLPLITVLENEPCDYTIRADLSDSENLLERFDNDPNWNE